MANDYPQIVDKSTLTGVYQADQFLVVGVEGQMDVAGSQAVGLPALVTDPNQAATLFGPSSSLTKLVQFCLGRGLSQVWAVASASGTTPTLLQRQTAWAPLEDNRDIRIRLTDSVVQGDQAALADSCENAEGIQCKQHCYVGIPAGTTKAAALTWAAAVASKRGIVTAAGVYDSNGNLLGGQYGAAYAACEVAKNPDISDSMNNMSIAGTSGVEKETATGLPVFRQRTNGGTPLNDLQDLLTAGISPYALSRDGRARFTHLRTSWTVDTTFDALQTLLIKDQVFIDIRTLLYNMNAVRKAQTADNMSLAAKAVEGYLKSHADWVAPVLLPNGDIGYGVTVVPGVDGKSYTINYFGGVVRGTNVININGTLTIPA